MVTTVIKGRTAYFDNQLNWWRFENGEALPKPKATLLNRFKWTLKRLFS